MSEKVSQKTLEEKAKTLAEWNEKLQSIDHTVRADFEGMSKHYTENPKLVRLADVKERDLKILAILKEMPWEAELQCRKIEELLK